MFKTFSFCSILFGFVLSQSNYYIGDIYTLNLENAVLPHDIYSFVLEYNDSNNNTQTQQLDHETLMMGDTMVKLKGLDTYNKIFPLFIKQNTPGIIRAYSNVTEDKTEVNTTNGNVNLMQVIDIPSNSNSMPVQTINGLYKITNVSVASNIINHKDFGSAIYKGFLIDVNGTTWNIKTELVYNTSVIKCPIIKADGDYCYGPIWFNIPNTTVIGGPYIVNVMLTNNINSSSPFFTINGRDKLILNESFQAKQIITYNSTSIDIKLNGNSTMTKSINYTYAERGELDIKMDGVNMNAANLCLFVLAGNKTAQCGKVYTSKLTVLDWRFSNTPKLEDGQYPLSIYFDPDCQNNLNEMNKFNVPNVGIKVYNSAPMIPGIQAMNLNSYEAGNDASLDIMSSFENGVEVTYYFESCNIQNMSNYCEIQNISGSIMSKTFKITGKITNTKISLSKSLSVTDSSKNQTSKIVFSVNSCIKGTRMIFKQDITIKEGSSNSDSNALSAGAIVGIVCAGVLIFGLAAWWICMRKSEGDGYRQLPE